MIIALALAFTVWIVAVGEENPSREDFFPDAITIDYANLQSGLVVYHDSLSSVHVKVRAPQATWNQLRAGSFHVIADLAGLGAGDHQVKLTVQVSAPQAAVTDLDPGNMVDVELEQVKSRRLDVHSQILDPLPIGYDARPPVISPAAVTVSGPEILVDQVYEVVADVYLLGSKVSVSRDVTVLARDAQGQLVQGVTINPATVNASVQVEQRVGYKDVSVRTILKGAPASGYWVSNITVTPSSATVVGAPDALGKIAGFVDTIPIDITGATSDISRPAGLSLPQGVSVLNNEAIVVQISVTPILGGQTVPRKVVVQGLARGLSATVSPDSADVIISGPVPALSALSPDAVQVVVDSSNLTAGTYIVKPRILSLPQTLNVQSIVPDTFQMVISGTPVTPTVTATVPAATVQPTSTPSE